jgi:hypothetical protein
VGAVLVETQIALQEQLGFKVVVHSLPQLFLQVAVVEMAFLAQEPKHHQPQAVQVLVIMKVLERLETHHTEVHHKETMVVMVGLVELIPVAVAVERTQ